MSDGLPTDDGQRQISDAIGRIFSPQDEPVMWASVVTSTVFAYLSYFGTLGYELSAEAIALIVANLNLLAVLVRSQYTPYRHRAE